MSLASKGSKGSAPDSLAKIPGSAPTFNSVQRNQIYLYPKIVGGHQALVDVLILKKGFFHLKIALKQHFGV